MATAHGSWPWDWETGLSALPGRDSGLAPHPDYQKAARGFGGVQAAQCAQPFTFGYRGKPFYRRGPKETEARALAIVRHLERRCGPGNYDYEVLPGGVSRLPLTLLERHLGPAGL